jgi:hypothetical protein
MTKKTLNFHLPICLHFPLLVHEIHILQIVPGSLTWSTLKNESNDSSEYESSDRVGAWLASVSWFSFSWKADYWQIVVQVILMEHAAGELLYRSIRMPGSWEPEDIDGAWLRNFSWALNNLFAPGIKGFDIDDSIPISHAHVTKLDSELISRENYTNEFEIVSIE